MTDHRPLNGWMLILYSLFLGPFFMTRYFHETRKFYPVGRLFGGIALLILILCAYLLFTFSISPGLVRIAYAAMFLVLLLPAFLYRWVLILKATEPSPAPTGAWSLSRAVAWMIFFGFLFPGLNNLVQSIYFWLFGERIAVYFSEEANLFKYWTLIGLVYGFVYGLRKENGYVDRGLPALFRTLFLTFCFIALFSGLALLLVIYPLQRLAPIEYRPQFTDRLFYGLLLSAILFSVMYLLRGASRRSLQKAVAVFMIGIPLITLHTIVVSGYSVTLGLTVASVLEDRRQFSAAKALYAKAIPHIHYQELLASLHHRQGVLQVWNQDYAAALASFKKVMADYSENYSVYRKAKRYVESFEATRFSEDAGRKILSVRHQTFEQAASCFPNSLSVVLNFYEPEPISTRELSYAIKEGFSRGTFVWKAETFLEQMGYHLITTLWGDKDTLLTLLNAGYPVLVYIPGHVYTVYGYDARMEMFFTYDTAKSNRWNDKPFREFQRNWMKNGFQMSVVVRKEHLEQFTARFPGIDRYARSYQVWQKTLISAHYAQQKNYWKDFNPYALAESIGLDRLKINASELFSEDFAPFPWEEQAWREEVMPVFSRPWALQWSVVQNHLLYLLKNRQPEEALAVIRQYTTHLTEDGHTPFNHLRALELAALLEADRPEEALSAADNLIGSSKGFFWGPSIKAKMLMEEGNLEAAARLLLPVLDQIKFEDHHQDRALRRILSLLDDIRRTDERLIPPDKSELLELARIHLGMDPRL
ncbi:MAG: hypothetical protein ACOC23_07000 [Thermodesulfobacteriota bacterium]